eukprot:4268830-Prymnesium_polylepis.2
MPPPIAHAPRLVSTPSLKVAGPQTGSGSGGDGGVSGDGDLGGDGGSTGAAKNISTGLGPQ